MYHLRHDNITDAYDLIKAIEVTQQELRKVNEAIESAERQVAMLAANQAKWASRGCRSFAAVGATATAPLVYNVVRNTYVGSDPQVTVGLAADTITKTPLTAAIANS